MDRRMSAIVLSGRLIDKYKERIKIDPVITVETGSTVGTLDGKDFVITTDMESFTIMSSDIDKKEVFAELTPVLNEVMKGHAPIIQYDTRFKGVLNKISSANIEWRTDEEEADQRIRQVVNGLDEFKKIDVSNIKLFNGKDISEYQLSQEEKEEMAKNVKIFGLYPGTVNTEEAARYTEAQLFLAFVDLGNTIFVNMIGKLVGEKSEINIPESLYGLEYLAYQTRRFGVELPEAQEGKHVTYTESFLKWFDFYNSHFHNLPKEEFQKFNKLRREGKDISKWLPKGRWQDHIVISGVDDTLDQFFNMNNTPGNDSGLLQ